MPLGGAAAAAWSRGRKEGKKVGQLIFPLANSLPRAFLPPYSWTLGLISLRIADDMVL
jgi:hypothetical protein